jgi:hypothetical protein
MRAKLGHGNDSTSQGVPARQFVSGDHFLAKLQSFHSRWVPRLLTTELKEQQRIYATEMMVVLLSAQKDG